MPKSISRKHALLAALAFVLVAALEFTAATKPMPEAQDMTRDQARQLLKKSGVTDCAEVVNVWPRGDFAYRVRCYDNPGSFITVDYTVNALTHSFIRH
ncbi:hypothetical protein [Nitratidesulfovibrio liaohensis]|uniref:hypothetical protein n=1 Tax=Nitratidesulfovibrio liaohensis TaxID=2604158 RepID=UPI0014211F16|nr:hypothetical protein [Nitratidesulfovibrio liaohensis]NHZ45506.1 hypothetical protein [Nitratidesulfovibrio liaohensis]